MNECCDAPLLDFFNGTIFSTRCAKPRGHDPKEAHFSPDGGTGRTGISWMFDETETARYRLARVRGDVIDNKHPKPETVNHPSHYGGDTTYEHIKVVRAWGLNYELGNATKYICRAGKKDQAKTVEDLEKAVWYLQAEIERRKQEKT